MFKKLYTDKIEITEKSINENIENWHLESFSLYDRNERKLIFSNKGEDAQIGIDFFFSMIYSGNLGKGPYMYFLKKYDELISDFVTSKNRILLQKLFFPYIEFKQIISELSENDLIQWINIEIIMKSVFYFSENFRLYKAWSLFGDPPPNKKYDNRIPYIIDRNLKQYYSTQDTPNSVLAKMQLDKVWNPEIDKDVQLEYLKAISKHDTSKLNKFYFKLILQNIVFRSTEKYKPNDSNYLSDGECVKILAPLFNFVFKISGQGSKGIMSESEFFKSANHSTYEIYNEYCRQFVKAIIS